MVHSFLSACFFPLYSALWRLARPWLRRGRPGEGWKERLVPPAWANEADLWIQAASGGEAHLAVAVLNALRQERMREQEPSLPCRVLVTTWTRQGRDVLEKALPALCASPDAAGNSRPVLDVAVRYAPLDEPAIVRRAVAQVRPRALILLETELWPGLLAACADNDVPVHVFNARMTRSSERGYELIRAVLRRLPVRAVHATSDRDAARFRRVLGPEREHGPTVSVMPNIKLDRAATALANPMPLPPRELTTTEHGGAPCPPVGPGLSATPEERRTDLCHAPEASRPLCAGPIILLASVRRQEETALLPMAVNLRRQRPDATLIIVPRHMHRVKAWLDQLHGHGLQPVAVTSLGSGERVTSARPVVWDRFGELPRLYAAADAVFVGGSLGLGGQNFLEALSAGVVPCVGPSLDNFRWALGEDRPPSLMEAGLLHVCPTVEAVERRLLDAVPLTPEQRRKVRHELKAWLAPRTGGAVLAARLLQDMLNAAPCGCARQGV